MLTMYLKNYSSIVHNFRLIQNYFLKENLDPLGHMELTAQWHFQFLGMPDYVI